jgi:hypothetical protein
VNPITNKNSGMTDPQETNERITRITLLEQAYKLLKA